MPQPVYSNIGFEQPLEIRKGSTLAIQLVATNGDGVTPYDLTGCLFKARIVAPDGSTYYDFVADAPVGDKCNITLPAGVSGSMVPTPTGKLVQPDHKWQCDLKLADGSIVPFCYGPVTVVNGLAITFP